MSPNEKVGTSPSGSFTSPYSALHPQDAPLTPDGERGYVRSLVSHEAVATGYPEVRDSLKALATTPGAVRGSFIEQSLTIGTLTLQSRSRTRMSSLAISRSQSNRALDIHHTRIEGASTKSERWEEDIGPFITFWTNPSLFKLG